MKVRTKKMISFEDIINDVIIYDGFGDDYINYINRKPFFDKRIKPNPIKSWNVNTVTPIKKVIFSDPATIVIWEDDTKTIVKAGKNDKGKQEKYDPEKGLAMAICKKLFGTNKSGSNYYEVFKKWLEE